MAKRAKKIWYVFSHGGFIGTLHASTKAAALRQARGPGKFREFTSPEGKQTHITVKPGEQSNPARKSVRLKNFTGTITRGRGGTVQIKGKAAKKKRAR